MSDASPSEKPVRTWNPSGSKPLSDRHEQKPRAESPTTARELDFDDEPQEIGNVHSASAEQDKSPSPKPRVSFADTNEEHDAPPAKPPRPLSPKAQAENTLIEAFPNIDTKVVKAVLMASGGRVEPAFNALLGNTSSFRDASLTNNVLT